MQDNNILVSQHFFGLRLSSAQDTATVLQALQRASVVTDPKNPQLVQLSGGPKGSAKTCYDAEGLQSCWKLLSSWAGCLRRENPSTASWGLQGMSRGSKMQLEGTDGIFKGCGVQIWLPGLGRRCA